MPFFFTEKMEFDTLGMELITKFRRWESDLGQNLGWKLGFESLEDIFKGNV